MESSLLRNTWLAILYTTTFDFKKLDRTVLNMRQNFGFHTAVNLTDVIIEKKSGQNLMGYILAS